MNIYSTKGALFKVKLPRFSYTVITKATGVEYIRDLLYESKIYSYLLLIQDRGVPVHLGDIKVDSLLYYARAVYIVYIMFLSFDRFLIQALILATLTNKAICVL
jgi:hypothetical protein